MVVQETLEEETTTEEVVAEEVLVVEVSEEAETAEAETLPKEIQVLEAVKERELLHQMLQEEKEELQLVNLKDFLKKLNALEEANK